MEQVRDSLNEVGETVAEEIRLRGREIGVQLRDLVREGNARRLILRDHDEHKLLEVSLTVGIVGGLTFLLFVPPRLLAVLGILMLFVRVYVVIEPIETPAPATSKRSTKARTSKLAEAS
jgi:hypothetical protein